jgi:hypothetical protein
LVSDFVGTTTKPYTSAVNIVGQTLTSGPEGSLILTIVYAIDEKVIVLDDLVPANFETLIARPIHGKPVGVGGLYAASTAFTATADSPYTGTVSWDEGTAPYARQKFDISENPVARVVLTPKPGYIFNTTGNTYNTALSNAVAIEGPAPTGGNFVAGAAVDRLTFTLPYISGTDILQQITSLDGLSRTDINPITDDVAALADETTIIGGISPIADGVGKDNIIPLSGVVSVSKEFIHGVDATVKVILEPGAGYTFAADAGPLPYLTYNDTEGTTIKTLIEEHFSAVYKGTTVTDRVKSIEAPYLIPGNPTTNPPRLVLTLKFPPKPTVINEDAFADPMIMGSNLSVIPVDTVPIPATTTITDFDKDVAPFDISDIVWETEDTVFTSGETYTAKITLTPKDNYTFIGSPVTDIEFALDDGSTGIWGDPGAGGSNIILDETAITVTGVLIGPHEDAIPTNRDVLVITLEWTAIP